MADQKSIDAIRVHRYRSPVGNLVLGSLDDRLCLCDWDIPSRRTVVDGRLERVLRTGFVEELSDVVREACRQLDGYFGGKLKEFDIPLLFAGTEFQTAVWDRLRSIPYGLTMSYGELAATLGRPEAVRAVAAAVGANAISLFVPCHRIVGSDRSLTGYAGGLAAKRMLLEMESGDMLRF